MFSDCFQTLLVQTRLACFETWCVVHSFVCVCTDLVCIFSRLGLYVQAVHSSEGWTEDNVYMYQWLPQRAGQGLGVRG